MAAGRRFGRLDGEQAAREGDIGAVRVELGLGVRGQRGEVDQRGAEAGDPSGRRVDLGDPLDEAQEPGRGQWFAAEPPRGARPVEPRRLELGDHVPGHMPFFLEFLAAPCH